MMSENIPPPATRDRPFPWPCIECRNTEVFPQATDYTARVKHEGRVVSVHIPDLAIPTCRRCGEQIFSGTVDDRIRAALRAQVELVTQQPTGSTDLHLQMESDLTRSESVHRV